MPTAIVPGPASPPLASADASDDDASAGEARAGGAARRWRWLGLYFGAWAAIAGMYIVILGVHDGVKGGPAAVLHVVVYSAASWSIRALVLLPGVWLARRVPFTVRSWPRALLVHLPAGAVLGVAKAAAYVWLAGRVPVLDDTTFAKYWPGDLPFNVLSYWGVVAAVHGVDYYRRYHEREMAAARLQLRASQLETRLAQAQLDALKAQLEPHFLFNTLHSISALIHEDPEAADLMVSRLSEFLRMVLDNAGAQEVPLAVELEFLERYLEIQQTRFRQRLRTEVDVEPGTLDARVPNLLLQPLVENAIRHAVEPRAAGGSVRVSARRDGPTLRLLVRDDGPGLEEGPRNGSGVGLANTRERLRQLYGPAHGLALRNHPEGGLEVAVALPYRTGGEG